jgi:hypothetical protein
MNQLFKHTSISPLTGPFSIRSTIDAAARLITRILFTSQSPQNDPQAEAVQREVRTLINSCFSVPTGPINISYLLSLSPPNSAGSQETLSPTEIHSTLKKWWNECNLPQNDGRFRSLESVSTMAGHRLKLSQILLRYHGDTQWEKRAFLQDLTEQARGYNHQCGEQSHPTASRVIDSAYSGFYSNFDSKSFSQMILHLTRRFVENEAQRRATGQSQRESASPFNRYMVNREFLLSLDTRKLVDYIAQEMETIARTIPADANQPGAKAFPVADELLNVGCLSRCSKIARLLGSEYLIDTQPVVSKVLIEKILKELSRPSAQEVWVEDDSESASSAAAAAGSGPGFLTRTPLAPIVKKGITTIDPLKPLLDLYKAGEEDIPQDTKTRLSQRILDALGLDRDLNKSWWTLAEVASPETLEAFFRLSTQDPRIQISTVDELKRFKETVPHSIQKQLIKFVALTPQLLTHPDAGALLGDLSFAALFYRNHPQVLDTYRSQLSAPSRDPKGMTLEILSEISQYVLIPEIPKAFLRAFLTVKDPGLLRDLNTHGNWTPEDAVRSLFNKYPNRIKALTWDDVSRYSDQLQPGLAALLKKDPTLVTQAFSNDVLKLLFEQLDTSDQSRILKEMMMTHFSDALYFCMSTPYSHLIARNLSDIFRNPEEFLRFLGQDNFPSAQLLGMFISFDALPPRIELRHSDNPRALLTGALLFQTRRPPNLDISSLFPTLYTLGVASPLINAIVRSAMAIDNPPAILASSVAPRDQMHNRNLGILIASSMLFIPDLVTVRLATNAAHEPFSSNLCPLLTGLLHLCVLGTLLYVAHINDQSVENLNQSIFNNQDRQSLRSYAVGVEDLWPVTVFGLAWMLLPLLSIVSRFIHQEWLSFQMSSTVRNMIRPEPGPNFDPPGTGLRSTRVVRTTTDTSASPSALELPNSTVQAAPTPPEFVQLTTFRGTESPTSTSPQDPGVGTYRTRFGELIAEEEV